MRWVLLSVAIMAGVAAVSGQKQEAGVELRRVPDAGIQPEAVLDPRGVLHLLYFGGDPAGGDLFYRTSRDGGASFTAAIRVNSQPGSALATGTIRGGQLAVGRAGVVHVGWTGSSSALPRGIPEPHNNKPGAPYLYARADAGGRSFAAQRNLNRTAYGLDGGSIGADDAGHVYAAWHAIPGGETGDELHRRVWLARSDDDGKTFDVAPIVSVPGGVCGCCGTRMLAPAARTLLILFRSALPLTERDTVLLSSNDGGASFARTTAQKWEISACPMSSAALASASATTIAAWQTDTQVFLAHVDLVTGRIGSIVAAPGQPKAARKHPRLAIAGDRVLMVWTEGTAWAKGGSLRWQEYDLALTPRGAGGSADGVPAWSYATPIATPDGGFAILY